MSSAVRAFSVGPFLSLFASPGHQALVRLQQHMANCGRAGILIPLPRLVCAFPPPPTFYLLDKVLL